MAVVYTMVAKDSRVPSGRTVFWLSPGAPDPTGALAPAEDRAFLFNIEVFRVEGTVAADLASVLLEGNITGGTDIEVSAGDAILAGETAPPSTAVSQGALFVGDGTGGTIAGGLYFRQESDGAVIRLDESLPPASATRSSVAATTTGSTGYVHAFMGAGLAVPEDGDYYAIFEGTAETGGGSPNGICIAIGVNNTTEQGDTERCMENGITEPQSMVTTVILPGLTTADDVRGLFRKESGGGSVRMTNRRLTIIKVR
jgi:hypothetical protein